MSSEIKSKVMAIVAEQLNVHPDELREEARFREDLEADSLDLVELVMECEDEFELAISDEDAGAIRTVGEAVAYIKRRLV